MANTWELVFKIHFGDPKAGLRFTAGGHLARHLVPLRFRIGAVFKHREFAEGPNKRSAKVVEKAFRSAKPVLEARVKFLKTRESAPQATPYKHYVQWVHLAAEAEMLWHRAADGDRMAEPPAEVSCAAWAACVYFCSSSCAATLYFTS